MISTTIHIFSVTKSLPAQNSLPAWAEGTKTWPQTVVLVVSCISLAFCLAIFYGYWRGGHRRAEKTAIYYTVFAVGFFIFSIVMWALAAGILQGARNGGNDKDIWGWSCVDGKRRELFSEKVDYALVCRLQVSTSIFRPHTRAIYLTKTTVLVPYMLLYRSRSRNIHHPDIRYNLLQIPLQAKASSNNGYSRSRSLRSLSRSTEIAICS